MTRILAGVSFGLLWMLAMWWLNGPLDWAPLLILALCGALAGLLFYWALGAWLSRIERRVGDARDKSRAG